MAREKVAMGLVGLLVEASREHGFFHVKAYPVTIGLTTAELARPSVDRPSDVHDDTIRNYNSRYERNDKGTLRLDDLVVYSQGSEDRMPKELYGWEVHYHASRVELRDAEAMARTLTLLHKRMAAMDTEFGYAGTFGQYLLRVAKAAGASRMVFTVAGQRFSSYTDRTHAITNLPDGARRADGLIADWQEGTANVA